MGTQPDESTNWRVVPGHAVLIKAFLLEMRQRPVHLWPESMRSCLAALVQENRPLTQVFARIIVSAAGTTSLRRVLGALHQLSDLMTVAATDEQPSLPGSGASGEHRPRTPAGCRAGVGSQPGGLSFWREGWREGPSAALRDNAAAEAHSYDLILQQIQYLLASQHFKVVGCSLIFLYNHLDRLAEERRIEVLSWLHDSLFGTLACHWSRVVRSSFMHIAVLKVLHEADRSPSVRAQVKRTASLDRRTASLDRENPSPRGLPKVASWNAPRSISVPSSLHLGNAVGGGAVPVSPAAEERALFGVARNDSLASRSSSATRLSKTVACDVEASLVRMAYAESLGYVQTLAEAPLGSSAAAEAAEQLGLDVVGEAGGAADTLATWQSYARHAWSEHNALQRKWAELRELLSRYPDAPAPPDAQAGRRLNGASSPVGQQPSRRQLTLSMAGLCESHEAGDEEAHASSDEW
mmetsp:Transcript_7442/g.24342  ORF Transcript_7442/g.24342 Transcript_7442/m.24342 type:complete len:466 (-) Transcript_7442:191-1588(-)